MKCEEKYAPKSLDEVIFPSSAVKNQILGYAQGQLEGNVMLWGPNGTGKSTLAKLLVSAIGGKEASIEYGEFEQLLARADLPLYLRNAAAVGRFSGSKKHFLILNEFDQAKKNVGVFWRALDACGTDVMTIITTNKPMEIDISLRSRCDVIGMPAITASNALQRIQFILQAEGLSLPNQQVLSYLKTAEHWADWRKYLTIADELLFLHKSGSTFPTWKATTPVLQVV